MTSNTKTAPQLIGRILLAEDSPDIQKLVSLVLEKTGADVVTVENGQRAVEEALANEFDLILMDIQMPVMDGMEATHHLRDAGYNKPIVALSGNTLRKDQELSGISGIDDYLIKPIVIDQFYHLLSRYLPPKPNLASTNSSQKAVAHQLHTDEKLLNDPEFQVLVRLFLNGLPQQVNDIITAIEKLDWDTVQKVSHKLKGSGTGFGHPQITNLSKEINRFSKLNEPKNSYQELRRAADALQSYCDEILKNLPR